MPVMDTGLFFLVLGIAGAFLFYSMNQTKLLAPGLRVFSFLLFSMVGMALIGGYEVSATTTYDNGVDPPYTQKDIFISADKGQIIGWVFLVLGMGASLYFFIEFFDIKLPRVR